MNHRQRASFVSLMILALMPVFAAYTSAEPVLEPNGRPAILNAQYASPEGVQLFSYTEAWDATKLAALCRELLGNRHGTELSSLKAVRLFHNPSPSHFRGEWKPSTPSGFPETSEIHLYNCSYYTAVEDFSLALSQEYSRLFTRYWITKYEGKHHKDRDTEWAQIRSLDYYPVRWSDSKWGSSYSWDPEQILSADYRMMSVPKLEESEDYEIFLSSLSHTTITPATSMPEVGEYWSRVTGLDIRTDVLQPPELEEVKMVSVGSHGLTNHEVVFSPATSDPTVQSRLRYVGAFYSPANSPGYGYFSNGFSQVSIGKPVVRFGPRVEGNSTYSQPRIPTTHPVYLRLYAFDTATRQVTYSPMYWYDFSDEKNPRPAENAYEFATTKFVPHVRVNGAEYALSPVPKMVDDTLYLPLTPLAKLLGWQVSWNDAYNTLIGECGEHTFAIRHFVDTAFRDGRAIPLEQKPIMGIKDLFVPPKLAAQLLSLIINWDLVEETATIKSLPPAEISEWMRFHNPNPVYANPEEIASPYSGPEPEFQRVTGVRLPERELTLAPGTKYVLQGGVEPAIADYRVLKWSSSEPTVASVSPSGEVLALREGVTAIRATSIDGGFTDECTLTVAIGAPPPSTTVKLTVGQLGASINEATLTLDACPYIEAGSGRTMVPLRFISEALGAGVQWLSATQKVLITDRDQTLTLRMGSIELYLNYDPIFMDCTPQNVSGRVFIPLRYVSEALGAKVTYNSTTKQLTIVR